MQLLYLDTSNNKFIKGKLMVKVGINGFGRIGRLILRAILENYKNKFVVAINDLGSLKLMLT